MRTIAVLNLKGGVAKTCTVINTAAILAERGERVLVIDADSQCNTTEFFGGRQSGNTLAKLLRNGRPLDGKDLGCGYVHDWGLQPTAWDGIELLAGSEELMDLDLSKVETRSVQAGILREMCEELERMGLHDFVLIDCPPAFNAASAAALLAADEVVIPIKLDAFSLRGMSNLMRQIANMRKINPKLKLSGLLPTMWYRSKNILDAEAQLKQSGLPVYHHIRRSTPMDDMTFQQRPIIESSPNSAASRDYRYFVDELIKGGARA